MICSECSRTAMTFARFLLVIYPRQIRCQHCGASLVWTPKWKHIWRYSLVVCFVLAVILAILRRAVGIGRLEFIAFFVVAAVIFAYVSWRKSVYVKGS